MSETSQEWIPVARYRTLEDLPVDELDARYAGQGEAYFRYVQTLADTDWYITHDRGGRPAVEITDSSGARIHGTVSHPTASVVHVHFAYPTSGEARLI